MNIKKKSKKKSIESISVGTPCELCSRKKEEGKRYNLHHIDYDNNITIPICFNCHQIVHNRASWGNPWLKKYGKTWMNEFSKKFQEVYEDKIQNMLLERVCKGEKK